MAKGVAIVTGAAQGMGEAIALRLASDGYDIAVNDINFKADALQKVSEAVIAKGRKSIVIPGDISKEDVVEAFVKETVEKLGSVDVMVANAGILSQQPIHELDIQKFDAVIAVNVRGTALCIKHAAIQMIKQGGGKIIAASSIGGKKGLADTAAYCSSKFAVRGLIQSASQDLGKHGITVNGYAPGPTWTPMAFGTAEAAGATLEQAKEFMMKSSPLNILGMPEDQAAVVSFLASPDARFISGQTISVDGGTVFD